MNVYRYSSYTMIIYGLLTLFSITISIAFLVYANGFLFLSIIGVFGLIGALLGEIIAISFCYRLTNDSITITTLFEKTVLAFDNIDHIKYFETKKNNGILVVGRDSTSILITNKTGNYKEMINVIVQKIVDGKLNVIIDPDLYAFIGTVK